MITTACPHDYDCECICELFITSISPQKLNTAQSKKKTNEIAKGMMVANRDDTNWVANPDPVNGERSHENIRGAIAICQRIDGFGLIYQWVQAPARNIRAAMAGRTPDDFAADWAIRVRLGYPDALELNEDRKTIGKFIYALVDCLRDESNDSVTEESVLRVIKPQSLVNLLQLFLPMDRAQALYGMRYMGREEYGMHWVAKQHVAASQEWKDLLHQVDGRPTMNKRLVWLYNRPAFGLNRIKVFAKWMTPCKALFL